MFEQKGMETLGINSNRFHELGTPKVFWTDRWRDQLSEPITMTCFRQSDAGKKDDVKIRNFLVCDIDLKVAT